MVTGAFCFFSVAVIEKGHVNKPAIVFIFDSIALAAGSPGSWLK